MTRIRADACPRLQRGAARHVHAFVHVGRRRINPMEETAGRPDVGTVNVVLITTGKDTGVAERFANLMPSTIPIVLSIFLSNFGISLSFEKADKGRQKRTKADKGRTEAVKGGQILHFRITPMPDVAFWGSSFSKADKSGVSDLPRPSCPQARWLGPTA